MLKHKCDAATGWPSDLCACLRLVLAGGPLDLLGADGRLALCSWRFFLVSRRGAAAVAWPCCWVSRLAVWRSRLSRPVVRVCVIRRSEVVWERRRCSAAGFAHAIFYNWDAEQKVFLFTGHLFHWINTQFVWLHLENMCILVTHWLMSEWEEFIHLQPDHHLRPPPPQPPRPQDAALFRDRTTSDLSPRMLAVGGTEGRSCCCSALVWTSRWSRSRCPSLPRTRVCGSAPSPAASAGTSESPRSTWRKSPILDPWTFSCTLCGFSWSPWFLKTYLQLISDVGGVWLQAPPTPSTSDYKESRRIEADYSLTDYNWSVSRKRAVSPPTHSFPSRFYSHSNNLKKKSENTVNII